MPAAAGTEMCIRDRVYQDLYRFALYTLKNTHDAEDMVSDTVTDAFASIHKLRSAEAFRGWIFKILSNKCRMKLKEYVNKTAELPDDLASEGGDMLDHMEVRRAFAKLDAVSYTHLDVYKRQVSS